VLSKSFDISILSAQYEKTKLTYLLCTYIIDLYFKKRSHLKILGGINAIAPSLNHSKTMNNIKTSLNQKPANRQPAQQILKQNQRVCLYDDTRYTGTLIRPMERTYPQRWTVELDRGGYDSAVVSQITSIAPQKIESNSDIPFNDEPEKDIKETDSKLQEEIAALKAQVEQLKNENEILTKDLAQAKQIIRRAKDITPLMRISLKRVLRLAHDACMDVQRTVGGWILKLGDKVRKFRRLADIWDILSQDEWYLEDVFPKDKLIAIDLIQAPKPRKLPIQFRPKQPKQPFPITREDLLIQRELASFRYG
jgi:hypothetical protein